MFIFGNYVELISDIYYQVDIIKDYNNIKNNKIDLETLKTLENMVVCGVNLDKIFEDSKYNCIDYLNDLKASAFIKTLRLFDEIGVNLFDSYIKANSNNISEEEYTNEIISKEISLDMRFKKSLNEHNKKYLKEYEVLKYLFNEDGSRISAINLIKKSSKDEAMFDFVDEYLTSRIVEPEEIIKDVNEMGIYKTKDEKVNHLIEKLIKYLFVDVFHYSLDNYMKLYEKDNTYLEELIIKIKMINDNPLTHNFIDNSLNEIDDLSQI